MKKKLIAMSMASVLAITTVGGATSMFTNVVSAATTENITIGTFATSNTGNEAVSGNFDVTYTFNNATQGTTNWENFVVEVNNGAGSWLRFRADAFGWTGNDSTSNWFGTVVWDNVPTDWETWNADMHNANVTVNIKRDGYVFTVTYDIVAEERTYHYVGKGSLYMAGGVPDDLNVCITGENVKLSNVTFTNNGTADNADKRTGLSNGLVAEYLFDDLNDEAGDYASAVKMNAEGTTLVEDTNRGNVVSMVGGVVSSVNLDTDTDAFYQKTSPSGLELPNSIFVKNNFSAGMTVSMWVKGSNTDGYQGLLNLSDQNGAYSWGFLSLNANPYFRYDGWKSDGFSGGNDPTASLAQNSLGKSGWELVTLVVTDAKISLYRNGVETALCSNATNCASALSFIQELTATGRMSFKLGTVHEPGTTSWNWHAFSGMVDDVRVYNRALSASEIETLVSIPADESVSETVENPPVYVQYKEAGTGYTVRLVAEVSISDLSNYDKIGFKFDDKESAIGSVVYKSIVANGKTINADEKSYFVVVEVTNVPKGVSFTADMVGEKDGQPVDVEGFDVVTVNMNNVLQ